MAVVRCKVCPVFKHRKRIPPLDLLVALLNAVLIPKLYQQTGGVLGPLRWTSNPVAFPFALKEPTPMVIGISHDVNTKEGHLSIAAKLNNNLDGKLMLPSGGDPVATLVASHRY